MAKKEKNVNTEISPEQMKEQHRVDHVVQLIKNRYQTTKEEYEAAHQETASVEQNYGQNAKINTYEIDDQMETNAEVQQQKALVSKNILAENILKDQLQVLQTLSDSPYFGRIDIQEDDDQPETLYIGTASFIDSDNNFLVYDWRAPIASIYYNGTLGPVTYQTPMGAQKADLLKKRQFKIKHGTIQHMFDTNETVGDDILQAVLGEHSTAYMQNIVATIQKEQNAIIRDTESDLLLVQGVAGSGKTSTILQRIAFLLYHSRQELNADQIVLFSPNLLFSNYISAVLPSLGERNMRQVTLAEFFGQRLQGLHVETLFSRYESQQRAVADDDWHSAKSDPAIMQAVKQYYQQLTVSQLQFTALSLGSEEVISENELRELYLAQPATMRPSQKIRRMQKYLHKKISAIIATAANSDQIQAEVASLTNEEYHDLMGRHEINQDIPDVATYLGQKLAEQHYAPIVDGIYNAFFVDFYAQYQAFLRSYLPAAVPAFSHRLEFHQIALDDCAPLLLLRDLLTEGGQNRSIQHLFVDEMQDYTPTQLLYLQHSFPKAKLTLLGDSEQALFNPMQAPKELLTTLAQNLNAKNPRIVQLNKSYRSTQEITNFMKDLLPDGDEIQSFTRHGDLPELIITPDKVRGLTVLQAELNKIVSDEQVVALITKNKTEATTLYQRLRRGLPVTLLDNADRSLPESGVVILPIYLAKGLEFDDVVAFDISRDNYPDTTAGILYTICSRAMHRLKLIVCGQPSPLLTQIAPEHYQIKRSLTS